MNCTSYYYNCSEEYVRDLSPEIFEDIEWAMKRVPTRETQSELNTDFWWLLSERGWAYDSRPSGVTTTPPDGLAASPAGLSASERHLPRSQCVTTTTLPADWHSDFAKSVDGGLVQLEVQFGKVEAMFKDFCGFAICRRERRLALGIEIVIGDPPVFFAHRKKAISGMAYFEIAKTTLAAIGLDCPIWLIGLTP